ncbi:hypothetical protein pdam_00017168 [Pocillopora damicornis]|uniref:Uncharacterized protein n=1 Tax=Pocillopora damicornis TaxID=46731 RepID=A0A3M6T580_POCDA|nr:hypothetical protein pdam_00017168 [Pocillopora damicornis]
MQSTEQHYYRETEEQNSNGRKLMVKKDAMFDSLDARERSYDNSAKGISRSESIAYAIVLSQAAQARASRKNQRLIHERVTCCVTRGTVENLNAL